MSLVRTAVVVLFSRFGSLIVGTLSFVYFTRELGAELFGSFVLFRTLVAIIGIFVNFGINDAVEKRISEERPGEVLSVALLLKFLLFSLVSVLVILLQGKVNDYIGLNLAVQLLPAIAVDQLGRQYASTLRGEQRVKQAEVGRSVQGFLFSAGGVALVYLGWEVRGLVTAFVSSWLIFIFAGWSLSETGIGPPTYEDLESVVSFAKYNFISSVIGQTAYDWIDTFVIGLFMSPLFVGGYEIAWRVANLATLVSKAIGKVLFPKISKWSATEDHERIQAVLPDAVTGALLFVMPAIFGVALVGDGLIQFVFGSEYVFAATSATVLMISRLFENTNDIISRTLLGIDRPDVVGRSVVVFVVVNTTLNFVLVYTYGIVGAAVATSISIALLVTMLTYALSKEMQLSFQYKRFGISIAASLGMAVVVRALINVVEIDSITTLISVVVVGVLTYIVFLASTREYRSLFREFVIDFGK